MGQGMMIAGEIGKMEGNRPVVTSFGVVEVPQCGQNAEVLKYHLLDSESLADKIKKIL